MRYCRGKAWRAGRALVKIYLAIDGLACMSRRVLVPLLVTALSASLLMGCGASAHNNTRAQGTTSAGVSTTRTSSITATGASSQTTSRPDLASCVSAWNDGSSRSDQQLLNGPAVQVSPDVVVATYSGPTEMVGQVGSVSDIPVQSRSCLVIAAGVVFVQQSDQSWGVSAPNLPGNFSAFTDPSTTVTEANAQASVGPGGQSGVGLLTADSGANIVTLTAHGVTGTPATSGGAGSTANPSTASACPAGQTRDGAGNCVNPNQQCPAGQEANSAGQCITLPAPTTTTTPSGPGTSASSCSIPGTQYLQVSGTSCSIASKRRARGQRSTWLPRGR